MKLYVFQVNNGSTLTFDTELAVQTVLDLKHAIQAKYKIAVQHQVLVVNGGECMVAERRVCSYSAGTDTNPIFLFNKEMILSDRAPTIPKTTFSIENEMELKVEESLMMPAVFHTVASRTQLAEEMFEVAEKLCLFCERLVHDEHLQHQGWAAIMANLDDCTLSYQKLLMKFDTAYTNYQQDFEDIKLKLTKLGTAVSVMAKIPLLECLTRQSYRESLEKSSSPHPRTTDEDENEDEVGETSTQSAILCPADSHKNRKSPSPVSASGEASSQASFSPQDRLKSSCCLKAALEEEEESPERGATPSFNVTLLDWINVQDRPNDVESVVRKCFDSINRLDPRIIQPFLSDCRETITKLDNHNMKAIKGLEDRLYALDQMIASCKRLVNEQQELAQGFLANQKRAENLKDTSVLPDLCLSHANQLMIMLTNHRKLLDIKQKCTTAKQELANNLQVRLKWCCYVMLHADQDGEKLQALLRLLTELLERVRVVEALSTVPQMYCLAVVEVVRRKMFIGHYRQWANALVKDGKNLYEAEKVKRECFGKLFRKSFLRNRLFRGLDSWPPSSFCTRKPRKFDFELPDISPSDLQYLKSCCPSEVQPYLRVPTLCDFEPLNQHVAFLHQLVQAAQSVDEMSQTITDLLNEQRFSCSQSAQRFSALTPRSESTTEITSTSTKTLSTKTLSTLSLKAPDCQPLALPGHLEDLSPDSIDAQTFDFETIGHPNMDPVLQQGSLDLDSLAESPESDFMSAVNEFVIENLMSPNPISDPTSPEMMVESLYSSVINAIDSKRIQDTTTLEKENSKIAVLKLSSDRYRSAAEESQNNLRKVKEDFYHFRGLVLKEQRDFGLALKTMTIEVRNTLNSVRYCHEEELREMQQTNLQNLKDDHENALDKLEREGRLKDLEARITELADARCKLEVEMALKEAEMEDMGLQYEEAKSTQEEVLRAELTTQTATLQSQIDMLNQQLQQKNEDYEVGLAELRALMRLEKDHCISELVDRHEEENTVLRQEYSALKQKSQEAEKDCEELVQKIQRDLQDQFDALQREKEDEQRAFQEKEQELKTVIGDLQAENSLLLGRMERERVEALQRAEKEKEEAVKAALQEALRDFQLQKEETETRLLGQIELLENQEASTGMETSAALSLDSGQWTEERASLLVKLELLERTKNEEMQNLKTSLIAEQQTNFNTVLTREKLKKERIISDLTEKLKNLAQQQEKDKDLIETLSEDRASILQEKKQMEEELNRLRSTVLVSSTFFPPNPIPVVMEAHGACGPAHVEVLLLSTPDPERLASVAAFKDEERVESAVEASMMTVHVNITRIIEQFVLQMSQSMSSVSSRHSEKIAIRDFQVGDLVLIILDERHDNYVLFTVGPTLYFLHSESLTALDLKPATGETRRPWVLGKVMEKEYCQAKKAQNRFKVPLGTKFYRVKAVPWNKKV
uniref:RB1-inducible coiled-coil protein 1 n=1 Tax=Sinocyclocheilus grahami TaxID=75366 RepID=A0A672LNY7_SINGR